MIKLLFLLMVPGLGWHTNESEDLETAEIKLIVHNIKSSEGLVRVAVFKDSYNFNIEPDFAFAFNKEEIENGQLECTFQLPKGQYAFSLLDDKNENNSMEFNKLGIPKEGFGFSNNAKIRLFKAPKFEKCKVSIEENQHVWQIKMRYI